MTRRASALSGILALTAALAACGQTAPDAGERLTPLSLTPDYVTTVALSATDTRADINKLVPGRIVAWHQDEASPYALVAQTASEAASTANDKVKARDGNRNRFSLAESAGATAWSGGVGAWSGGVGAWSGGVGAWSGGSTTQDSLNAVAWTQVGLAGAHVTASKLGAGVKVAVIDTGLDLAHPLFADRLAPSADWYDFVASDATPQDDLVAGGTNLAYGHGTAVAGVILQVAPAATILPLRVLNSDGYGDTDKVVAAIDFAVSKGAKVINLSLGANVSVTALDHAISSAINKGVFVVASSGNTGDTNITYPAYDSTANGTLGGMIGVGSVDSLDVKSAFSTYGTKLELLAPGQGVWTAYPGSQQAVASGTSFAAPIVSAGVALAFGQGSTKNVSEFNEMLGQTAKNVDAANPALVGLLGKGRVNLDAFVKKALDL